MMRRYKKRTSRRSRYVDGNHVHYGQKSEKIIKPSTSDETRVRRTYRTATVLVQNTAGQDALGFAWSMLIANGTNSGDLTVKFGGPSLGTTAIVGTEGGNFFDEFSSYKNIYKYFRVTKVGLGVEKLPLWTTMPAQAIWNTVANQANITQLGNPGNIFSPGLFLQRPWAGEVGVANYSTGALSGSIYEDNRRFKRAVTTPAVSKIGDGVFRQVYKPMQPYLEYQSEGSSLAPSNDFIVKYQRAPPIDISDFETNKTSAEIYGGVFVWYYPGSSGADTDTLNTHVFWEIEIEYYGVKIPSSASEQAQDKASKSALIAMLNGEDISKFPDPVHVKPQPDRIVHPVMDYIKVDQPEEKTPTLQPTLQQSLPKVVPASKPASRPSTPVLVSSRK